MTLTRFAPDAMMRARAIFTWIADHVSYDVEAFFSRRRSAESPQDVLRHRVAVCAGYAQLYQALCNEAGVRCEIVSGFAKGYGFDGGRSPAMTENHAWNAFRDDNGWHLVDSTWGAGAIEEGRFQRTFRPFYFDARPDQIVFTHLPTQPGWQLLEPPLPQHTFAELAVPDGEFYQLGLGLDSHHSAIVECGQEVLVTLLATQPVSVLVKIDDLEADFAPQKNGRVHAPIGLRSMGDHSLQFFAHPAPCAPGVPHVGVLAYTLRRAW